jgi:hypothetical protein
MQIIRNLADTQKISNTAIRKLVQQRINDLGGDAFDATELGYFLVVEDGDTLEALSAQVGFPVLCNRMTGIRYGEPGFYPSFELVEQIGDFFDAVFVLSDDGFAVEMLVAADSSVHPDLLAMFKCYALHGAP